MDKPNGQGPGGRGPMDQLTAHLDRGWDLVQRGDLPGARVSAEKSLELDPQSPEAHNLLGFVLAGEARAEEALDHYRQAIELDDTFVEAMLNAAQVLVTPLRDFDGAIAMVDDALELVEGDDETADALLLKFDALLGAGNREEAARVVKQLPTGPFENDHLELLIGRAKFEVGDVDGAEPLVRGAAERHPQDGEAQYYLALILEARGDARGATVAFLRARDADVRSGVPGWSLPAEQFEKAVQSAIHRLPAELAGALDGALVVVADVPGVEVVADGVDPRVSVLLDDLGPEGEAPRAQRVFVYQRNVERVAMDGEEMEDEVFHALEHELTAAYPALAKFASQPAESPPRPRDFSVN